MILKLILFTFLLLTVGCFQTLTSNTTSTPTSSTSLPTSSTAEIGLSSSTPGNLQNESSSTTAFTPIDCSVSDNSDVRCLEALENTETKCYDNLDNDSNGLIDCYDPGCSAFTFCHGQAENNYSDCTDLIDNDEDGKVDCDDESCKVFTICQPQNENTALQCRDGVDNDENSFTDCDDIQCSDFSWCQPQNENTPAQCKDGYDNDENGDTDCADEKCFDFAVCQPFPEGSVDPSKECLDGVDNDDDGYIDCSDTNCADYSFCLPEYENSVLECQDAIDNDIPANGLIDCEDEACQFYSFCQESSMEYCTDGVDNDRDGVADCADDDCLPFCETLSCLPANHVPDSTIDFTVTIYDKARSGEFDLRGVGQGNHAGPSANGGCTGSYEDVTHPHYTDSLWSPYQVVTKMVQNELGPNGLPVLDNNICYNATIGSWWTGTAIPASLTFTHEGNGTYKFLTHREGFFPLDGCIDGGVLVDGLVTPGAECSRNYGSRNYGFATHLHREFMYIEEGTSQQFFKFSGDDDVFVFINKKLVLELGGVHHPLDGSFTLKEAVAGSNLTSGDMIDFDVFIAERHMDGSQVQMSINIPCLTVPSE